MPSAQGDGSDCLLGDTASYPFTFGIGPWTGTALCAGSHLSPASPTPPPNGAGDAGSRGSAHYLLKYSDECSSIAAFVTF
eukprot:6196810-Pleurochrysis_carterae.AAC.2